MSRTATSARVILLRGPVGSAILALALGSAGCVLVHARVARARRAADLPAIEAIATRLPSSDLALSGGSRWLRAPSMEEPTAAFADAPAAPDPDPAGAMMAPPVDRAGPRR